MSALDKMLADVRKKGGEPKLLVVHPSGVVKLGGELSVRGWCATNRIKLRVSPSTPTETAFFITPPDASWK